MKILDEAIGQAIAFILKKKKKKKERNIKEGKEGLGSIREHRKMEIHMQIKARVLSDTTCIYLKEMETQTNVCIYIHIYMYIYTHTHTHIFIHTNICEV